MSLVKDTSTGQVVEFISYHDRDYAMVRDTAGRVYYPPLSRLLFHEVGVGTLAEGPQPLASEEEEEAKRAPQTVIPVDTRVNLNYATAEQLVALKGIGYATAKKIVELRNSLPGERFKQLDQLRTIERVNWEEVFKEDQFYIG
jgi:DNA uptake protein ComE-like DNA-binding protein